MKDLIQKKRLKKDLINRQVDFVDTKLNSPDFFNISYIPESFKSGKNLVKLKATRPNLFENSSISIEVLDAYGEPIYYEIIPQTDTEYALSIAVYVYENTPIGECTITFIGTSAVDLNFNPIPKDKIKLNNIKYVHRLNVNRTDINDSPIIIKDPPIVNIHEKKYSIIEEKFNNTSGSLGDTNSKQRVTYTTASYRNLYGKYIVTTTTDIPFIKDFENGNIEFLSFDDYTPVAGFLSRSIEYSTKIIKVNTPLEMEVSESAYVNGIYGERHLITKITEQPVKITFASDAKDVNVTQNIKSYAVIDINRMDTTTGQIDRIKVFSKSSNNPNSEYKSIYDYKVQPKNILTDSSSKFVETPIGKFDGNYNVTNAGTTSNTVNPDDYWQTGSNNGSITFNRLVSNDRIFGGLELIPTEKISGSTELYILQKENVRTQYYSDTKYLLKFDYYLYQSQYETRGNKIAIYATGSAFVSDTEYGKYIGEIQPTSSIQIEETFSLPINSDGDGQLRFVISPGSVIGNIKVQEEIPNGYNPNRTTLYVPLSIDHRLENLDFNIQFFNKKLEPADKDVEVFSTKFKGGNQYIYGDDNIITGSTYISPYTSSGIELYANINDGISEKTSGSAIQNTGYSGIESAKYNTSGFGFGITTGNPYNSSSYASSSVQMINEAGNVIDFKTGKVGFDFYLTGNSSSLVIGKSGSVDTSFGKGGTTSATDSGGSESYIKWDGYEIVIQGAVDANGDPIGTGAGSSGTSGTSGTTGTSGTSGTTGTSGSSGTAGTSGSSGSSGTSGTSGTTPNSLSKLVYLIYTDESPTTGTTSNTAAKSVLVDVSGYSSVVIETEIKLAQQLNTTSTVNFSLISELSTLRTTTLSATGTGILRLGGAMKVSQATSSASMPFTASASVTAGSGSWSFDSLRIYGVT